MKHLLFFILLFLSCNLFSQVSKIKVDSGNKNKVVLVQQGDSSTQSDIEVKKSDSNQFQVSQIKKDSASNSVNNDPTWIRWIKNTTLLTKAILGIAAVAGIFFGLIRRRKKTNRK